MALAGLWTSVYIRATMNWHQKILMTVAAVLLAAGTAAAQNPASAPAATLTGVIRDSAGGPLTDVEVP